MKYLTLFNTHTEYEEYVNVVGIALPNVSLCKKEEEVHFNACPYDSKIEYLESTGTQWINTNVFANLNTIVELEGAMTTVFNDNVFIGGDEGASTLNSFVIESYKQLGFLLCLDGRAPCFASRFSDTNYHHIKACKNYLIIDDSQFSTYEHGEPTSPENARRVIEKERKP